MSRPSQRPHNAMTGAMPAHARKKKTGAATRSDGEPDPMDDIARDIRDAEEAKKISGTECLRKLDVIIAAFTGIYVNIEENLRVKVVNGELEKCEWTSGSSRFEVVVLEDSEGKWFTIHMDNSCMLHKQLEINFWCWSKTKSWKTMKDGEYMDASKIAEVTGIVEIYRQDRGETDICAKCIVEWHCLEEASLVCDSDENSGEAVVKVCGRVSGPLMLAGRMFVLTPSVCQVDHYDLTCHANWLKDEFFFECLQQDGYIEDEKTFAGGLEARSGLEDSVWNRDLAYNIGTMTLTWSAKSGHMLIPVGVFEISRGEDLEIECLLMAGEKETKVIEATIKFGKWRYVGPMDKFVTYQSGGKLTDTTTGRTWEGDFVDNAPTGRCKMTSRKDGFLRVCEGDFVKCLPHGRECVEKVLDTRNRRNELYRGGFEQGRRSGQGTLTVDDPEYKLELTGLFKGGYPDGPGKLVKRFKTSDKRSHEFEGTLTHNRITRGREIDTFLRDGEEVRWIRTGHFNSDGRLDGKGEILYPRGSCFSGEIVDGVPHGKGTESWPNNPEMPTIKGNWVDGNKQGRFDATYKNSKYRVTFVNNKIHGPWSVRRKPDEVHAYRHDHGRMLYHRREVTVQNTKTLDIYTMNGDCTDKKKWDSRKVITCDDDENICVIYRTRESDLIDKARVPLYRYIRIQALWRGRRARRLVKDKLCRLKASLLMRRRIQVQVDAEIEESEEPISPQSRGGRRKKKRSKGTAKKSAGPVSPVWSEQCSDPNTQVGGAMRSGRYALRQKPKLVADEADIVCDLHGCTTLNVVDKMRGAVKAAKNHLGKRIGFITGPGSHSGSGKKKKRETGRPVLLDAVEELVVASWNRDVRRFPDGITCRLTQKLYDHLDLVDANKLA